MSDRYFRIQNAARDTAALPNPATWESPNYWNEIYIYDLEAGAETEDVRRGISTCRTVDDLAAYFAQTGIPMPDDAVLVEIEATLAEDQDHDHAYGAHLVHPTAIVSVTPVGDDFHALVDTYLEGNR